MQVHRCVCTWVVQMCVGCTYVPSAGVQTLRVCRNVMCRVSVCRSGHVSRHYCTSISLSENQQHPWLWRDRCMIVTVQLYQAILSPFSIGRKRLVIWVWLGLW